MVQSTKGGRKGCAGGEGGESFLPPEGLDEEWGVIIKQGVGEGTSSGGGGGGFLLLVHRHGRKRGFPAGM